LSAVPQLSEARPNHIKLTGEIPTPINLPKGCPFQNRCPSARARCSEEKPAPLAQPDGSLVACHGAEEGWLDAG